MYLCFALLCWLEVFGVTEWTVVIAAAIQIRATLNLWKRFSQLNSYVHQFGPVILVLQFGLDPGQGLLVSDGQVFVVQAALWNLQLRVRQQREDLLLLLQQDILLRQHLMHQDHWIR